MEKPRRLAKLQRYNVSFRPEPRWLSLVSLLYVSTYFQDFYVYFIERNEGKKGRGVLTAGGCCDSRAKRYEIEPPHLQLALFELELISWTLPSTRSTARTMYRGLGWVLLRLIQGCAPLSSDCDPRGCNFCFIFWRMEATLCMSSRKLLTANKCL